ncbi:hypothetical protein PV08_05226 [Exophiala spinifera]|uniref:Helicase ATP-binding domain-containing protein n=1 Tax=Exophiala spinifera TaxID=91928 RepID=A0A0D1YJM4_9EURO|nr:uncharacterized protein PV08_05226 [Exophiala spinifera]KIW15181.1 hypothetical protein PV08_05226 [Exophiala spinifera]
MGSSWQRSTVTHGNRTTLDLVREQTYAFRALAGIKRRSDGVEVESHIQERLQGQVSNQLRTRTPSLQPRSNEPRQPLPRLQASRIVPVVDGEDRQSVTTSRPVPSLPRFSSTPGPSQNPLLSLRHPRYALPSKLVDNLESLGVRSIYPWQSSCLLGRGLLEGEQNLVYTAPTGGGKSLVADVLLLRRIIENPGKKAIVVLPYVALVQEKLKWLKALVDGVCRDVDMSESQPSTTWRSSNTSIRVAGFFGGSKSSVEWPECDVAVCTIEKANSLVNAAIEEGKHVDLSAIVLDELHMLNEEHRGYILELLASKLVSLESGVQIIGMSATLSNPQLIAEWLKAKFYVAKYRPIPIEEHLVYENEIYPTANAKDFFRTVSQLTTEEMYSTPHPKACRTILKSEYKDLSNPLTNAVVALAVETALDGHAALIFCNSRLGAEKTACLVSDAMPVDCVDVTTLNKRQDLIASLQALPGGFEASLIRTISRGVGFHHAGLTTEERELVAEAYDKGV